MALAVALGVLALAVGIACVDAPEIGGARTGRFWTGSALGGFEGVFSSFSIFRGAGARPVGYSKKQGGKNA